MVDGNDKLLEARGGEKTPSLAAALAKPLITGASVSADRSSLSPGKKLARRYHPNGDIRTIAFGGTTGAEILKRVKPSDFDGRSIVIAVDLFFWDSAMARPTAAIAGLDRIVREAAERAIPLVLGEIPELLPGHQPGRETLNSAILRVRAEYPRCAVMPFERLFQQVMHAGYLEIRGKRYGLFDLVPDGLHLAGFAGDYLADILEEELKKAI